MHLNFPTITSVDIVIWTLGILFLRWISSPPKKRYSKRYASYNSPVQAMMQSRKERGIK